MNSILRFPGFAFSPLLVLFRSVECRECTDRLCIRAREKILRDVFANFLLLLAYYIRRLEMITHFARRLLSRTTILKSGTRSVNTDTLKFGAKDFSRLFKLSALRNVGTIKLAEKARSVKVRGGDEEILFHELLADSIPSQVRRSRPNVLR